MDASAVFRVVDKLSQLIYQEANYLGGFRDAVEWLNTELHRIQCFLKDAEPKGRKGDERVKNWVREIRDVAYEIEDLTDIIGAASRKNHRRSKRGFVGSASRYASAPFDYYSRHHLLCRIDRIKEKIVDISRSREIFGISNLGDSGDPHVDVNFPTPLLASPDFEDDVPLVGFEEDKELLVRHLIDPQNHWRSFIAVVGMGGLGKTTLAKKVFRDPRVRRQFDVLCWVTVSKSYRGAEFLNYIAEKVMGCTGEELGREEFKRKLDQQFQGRRCLIVLDDVWLSSTCEDLKRLFPDYGNGSRVLLTTRSLDVARSADPSFAPHMPRFLDDDESWELLQRKAFPSRRGHERRCSSGDLEEVGRKLAKKCHGLPLALVVLGSLLFKKGPFPATWNQVFESLDWEFMEDGKRCFDILELSYDDLPDDSYRSCFLYISSFPEGSEIFASRLIELWNAEGFIRPRPKEAVEKTAKDYIDELSQRCMVQVVKRIADHGPAKSIRIHDLLREWCISMARREGFLHVIGDKEKNTTTLDATSSCSRRTALLDGLNGGGLYVPSPKLRALLAFNCKFFGNSKQLSFPSLCALRVLYLEGSSGIMKLPEDIKNMVHLRYLGLKARLVELPPSVGDLPYLEVLDARLSRIMQLPSRLWRIATLKKVYVGSVEQPVKVSELGNSQSLRVVEWVDIAGGWIERTENEISGAPSFRKLGITGIQKVHRKALTKFLRKLRHLASLSLCFSDYDGEILIYVLRSLSDHHQLRSLKLHGRYFLAIVRRAWAFPPNLTKLVLNKFEFLQDPMEALEKLRHLVDLQILAPEVGHCLVADYKVMTCSAGGFPRLQHLQLYGLKVEEWTIEASAMRSLTSLTMISMANLRKVPEGLQHIATLQELAFNDMSKDFYRRIRAGEGEDWHFIDHVPSVSVREGCMKIWLSDSFPSQQLKAFIFSRRAAKEFIMGGRSSNVPEQ